MSNPSHLSEDDSHSPAPLDSSLRSPWLPIFGLIFLLLPLVYFTVSFLSPSHYTGITRIDVSPSRIPFQKAVVPYDPFFIQTQFERLKSDTILTNVLNRLRSAPGFAEHTRIPPGASAVEALRLLRESFDLRQHRGTSLIEIRAHTQNPITSAELANQIAETYIASSRSNGIEIRIIDQALPPTRPSRK